MANQEFNNALKRARATLDLMERHVVPPFPKFYELLFGFVSGTDPILTENIYRFFRERSGSEDVSSALYDEFLKPHDNIGQLLSVSEAISNRIAHVEATVGTALVGAASYSKALGTTAFRLGDTKNPESLKALVGEVLQETRQMQESNAQLTENLESSKGDIAALRGQIEQAKREANLDALTQLSNRREFETLLAQEVVEARRQPSHLSAIMADIDHFKRFNDTFGHQTGDRVLQLVAMTIRAHTKGKDVAARYGGEEFVLLLPDTDMTGAVIVAENVRKALQSKELVKRDTGEKLGLVTASFGVASLGPEDTASSVIERADRCLYAAKAGGRNRVISEAELVNAVSMRA